MERPKIRISIPVQMGPYKCGQQKRWNRWQMAAMNQKFLNEYETWPQVLK